MTIRTESRITIASSIGEVWDYVCDVGRWPEWAPTVLECWVRGGGPLQPGSRVDQRAKDLGRTHPRSQEVTAVEAPPQCGVRWANGYVRVALGNGTRAVGR
jgi:hypothetical protein